MRVTDFTYIELLLFIVLLLWMAIPILRTIDHLLFYSLAHLSNVISMLLKYLKYLIQTLLTYWLLYLILSSSRNQIQYIRKSNVVRSKYNTQQHSNATCNQS